MKNIRISTTYERLGEARVRLECLDLERSLSGDPLLGKSIEQRIVWRELLDLELQDVDEQIERICAEAQNLSRCPAESNAEPN